MSHVLEISYLILSCSGAHGGAHDGAHGGAHGGAHDGAHSGFTVVLTSGCSGADQMSLCPSG